MNEKKEIKERARRQTRRPPCPWVPHCALPPRRSLRPPWPRSCALALVRGRSWPFAWVSGHLGALASVGVRVGGWSRVGGWLSVMAPPSKLKDKRNVKLSVKQAKHGEKYG